MENKETFANKEAYRICGEVYALVGNKDVDDKKANKILSLIDKVHKLNTKALKEAKQSKGAISTDKYEPEAMQLVREAQSILYGLKSSKE